MSLLREIESLFFQSQICVRANATITSAVKYTHFSYYYLAKDPIVSRSSLHL